MGLTLSKAVNKGKLGVAHDANVSEIERALAKLNTVAFSATPEFDVADGNIQKLSLTANVTSSTLVGGAKVTS